MSKYGQAAIEAVELLENGYSLDPRDAWEKSTERIFGKGTASQRKGCPRGTFLGLCEEGLINSVDAGNYCRSQKNKDYAVKAKVYGVLHH